MKRTLAGLIALLLSALPAVGQVPNFPQTVPAQTLVGRLGVSPGPTQAIPISTLAGVFGSSQSVTTNAKCDGATDDTAAINADLARGGYWTLPPNKTCNVTQLNFTVSGTRLSGSGFNTSILQGTTANVPVINISAGLSNVYLDGFQVTNNKIATSGSYGIRALGDCQYCVLDGIFVQKQYVGISLQSTGVGYMRHVLSQYNLSDGISFQNSSVSGTVQWDLDDVYSAQNVGRGFIVTTGAAGPSGITLGSWHNVRTFANSGVGAAFVGTSGIPINGIRITKGFLGQDGNHEIFLDTYGGLHTITATYAELAGTSATGPTLATAASNTGDGIRITANNTDVSIGNAYINGNHDSGVNTSATVSTSISGYRISNHGIDGILSANCALLTVTGINFVSNTSANIACTSNGGSQLVATSTPSSLNTYLVTPLAEAAAPSTPASGFGAIWFDSTNHVLSAKNSSGTITNTVVPTNCSASQWISQIAATGAVTCAPVTTNSITRAMEAQGVARSVIGVTGNATANVADIQGTASQFLGVNSAGTALAFQTMSGDCALSGAAITCSKSGGVANKIALTGNLTLNVTTTGSDANGCTNNTTDACLTIQHAYDVLANGYDLRGNTATIQVANGTYTAGLITSKCVLGQNGPNGVQILGSATPSNVLINVTSTDAFGLGEVAFGAGSQGCTQITIGGMKLQTNTAGNAINVSGGGVGVTVGVPGFPIEFGTTFQDHMIANHSAWIIAGTNNLVSGNALIHVASLSNAVVALHGTTETFSNTLTFTYFAYADVNASLYLDAMTFAGTAGSAIGQRYFVQNGGVIYTLSASATYLPGNSSGVAQSKGNYVTNGVSQWSLTADVTGVLPVANGGTGASVQTAVLQASPGNPTGTSTTTPGVMMGLGTTCKLTPTVATRVNVRFDGLLNNNTSSTATAATVRWGTGTAPINGAAATGTVVGATPQAAVQPANYFAPFSAGGIITGLTPGTAYWFDLAVFVTANTGTVQGIGCSAFEVP